MVISMVELVAEWMGESKESGILIEVAIIWLESNLVPGNIPGIHKDDPR